MSQSFHSVSSFHVPHSHLIPSAIPFFSSGSTLFILHPYLMLFPPPLMLSPSVIDSFYSAIFILILVLSCRLRLFSHYPHPALFIVTPPLRNSAAEYYSLLSNPLPIRLPLPPPYLTCLQQAAIPHTFFPPPPCIRLLNSFPSPPSPPPPCVRLLSSF